MGFSRQGWQGRADSITIAALALFFAFFYIVLALDGDVHHIAQAALSILFVPVLLLWNERPLFCAYTLLALYGLWTVNWVMALPENLGFSPFVLVVPFAIYVAARFMPRAATVWILSTVGAILAFFTPFMWQSTDLGLEYRPGTQAASWVLIQWLFLSTAYQIGRRQFADQKRRDSIELDRQWKLEQQQLLIRTKEREMIAREIHDIFAKSLTLISMQASAGKIDTHEAVSTLDNIQKISSSALNEVRTVVYALKSLPGTEIGVEIGAGASGNLSDLPRQIGHFESAGLHIATSLPSRDELADLSQTCPAVVQLAVRRVVDESLVNVVRHQGPHSSVDIDMFADTQLNRISLRISSKPEERVQVRKPSERIEGTGNGLIGMSDRVRALGGLIEYFKAGNVFVVDALLPITLDITDDT